MLETILSSSDLKKLNAKVEIFQGSTSTPTYTCMCEDFLESFAVYREGDTSKLFGFGVCHKLDCKLIDLDRVISIHKGDTIKIGFGNKNTDSWDYPFPTLYVTEHATDEKNNTISLTAHDKLYFASEHFLEELNILGSPTTPKDVFTACGAALGIPTINWTEARSINLLHEDTPNFGGGEDLRTVMNYVAEVTGNIYFIGEDDSLKLRAVRVSEPVKAIGKANYYELSVKEAVVLKNICSVTELGENLEPHTTIEEGVMQYLKENPFLNLTDDAATLVDNLAAAVQGLATWQVDCDWEGNHLLEIGDCIAFEKNDGSMVTSILLNDVLSYAGYLNQVTEWEYTQSDAETATNSTTLGDKLSETFAKVNKLEKNITLYVGDVVDEVLPGKIEEATGDLVGDVDALKQTTSSHTSKISTLEINTSGITQQVSQLTDTTSTLTNELGEVVEKQTTMQETVSQLLIEKDSIIAAVGSLEQTTLDSFDAINTDISTLSKRTEVMVTPEDVTIQINSALDDGVSKVTTSTGYTFDEDGLHISKAGSTISSTLDEDGLIVSRSNTPVLEAVSDGVNAINISVKQYLKVGGSRFQTYGYNRTGCFWIGE